MTDYEIREMFRYHPMTKDREVVHEKIREKMTDAVLEVAKMLPYSGERSTFITLMQQAQMMANAAIAIHFED